MAYTFNPVSGGASETEFAGTTGRAISIVNDDVNGTQFELKSVDGSQPGTVSYSHPYGFTFSDMVITIAGDGLSFTYASQFQYAFKRITHFLIQDQPTPEAKQYSTVISPHLLPANFKGIYRVEPPADSIELTWTLTGRERSVVDSVPGAWTAKTITYVSVLTSSIVYTGTAIKNAVKQGQGYLQAVQQYPEVELP